jgi:hexosaminidase
MEQHRITDVHDLQTLFNQRILKILAKHRKRMMGWDEIFRPGLPKEIVVQSWRGQKSLFDAARQGYDGILSAGYYIDLLNTAASHYVVDPLPADNDLTADEAKHVLGGEATRWGEWVGPETIDSRIWPRTAAIAERFWSPREVKDVDDMYRRLGVVSLQLEELGLTHERNVDVLLRRLAGTREIAPLRVLLDVVEPVKGYTRGSQQKGTTFLPLTHFVDAATVDAPGARATTREIAALLDDAPRFKAGVDALKARFTTWRDTKPAIDALIDRSPSLAEVVPLAADLADLGAMGLEALRFLELAATPDASWRDARLALLDRAARPKAALSLPFTAPMRELVVAVMERSALATEPVADWRARVKTLAAPPRRGRGGG